MSDPITWLPSKLFPGELGELRERTLTRWLAPELVNPAGDFCRHLGLFAIYAESAAGRKTRYLFWNLPKGAGIEIRSARTQEQFNGYDAANRERGWRLLSLHVSEDQHHSAVWITEAHFDEAALVLAAYGITPPQLANS